MSKGYSQFVDGYLQVNSKELKSTSLKEVAASDAIITLGSMISRDNPDIKNSIDTAIKTNKAQFVYMHPIDDEDLRDKYTQYVKYEAGSEESVIAMLCAYLIKDCENDVITEFIDDLDIGYISGESSVGEEELELIEENFAGKTNKLLIIGSDIFGHSKATNIGRLVACVDRFTDFNVLVVPSLFDNEIKNIQTENKQQNDSFSIEPLDEIKSYNGTVIYRYGTLESDSYLRGSSLFAQAAKIKAGDKVDISYGGETTTRLFKIDKSVKGTVALYSLTEDDLSANPISLGYRFKQVKIEKVES